MDGSPIEHSGSDSDSGESWTLLEASSAYADEVAQLPEHAAEALPDSRDNIETNYEKDEDTDGISIISDSDPELSFPCEVSYNRCLIDDENCPAEERPRYFSVKTLPDNNEQHESVRSKDDFLGEGTAIHKTYVHRRNKRLSTVLNIIVLGSVITAAGVAIGHMWGAKNDCTIQNAPSFNKILSNLYKLQEENSYLRSKLKELTLLNNLQIQKKYISDKWLKQNKCKKVFEESLNNKDAEKYTKCVDNDSTKAQSHVVVEPDYGKEFLNDIDQLKLVYKPNKSWLYEEISKNKKHLLKPKSVIIDSTEKKPFKDVNLERQLETISEAPYLEKKEFESSQIISEKSSEKKVSYADSLQKESKAKIINKRDTDLRVDGKVKDVPNKQKAKKTYDAVSEYSFSDDELKKDDRYIVPKYKLERKKHDRQKSHKKQKRKNKYEQWEMKGGYMKDYDDISSITSFQNIEVENLLSADKNNAEQNNIGKLSESNDNNKYSSVVESSSKEGRKNIKSKNNKEKDATWFDNRASLRMEARKRLQSELFDETSPNTARWYFRRMERREQCRTKGDNSTHKRVTKRDMNFKVKH